MFKWNRVLVALIGIPLLLFVYAGESFFRINLYGLPMLIFTNLVIGIGTYEFYKMIKKESLLALFNNISKLYYSKLFDNFRYNSGTYCSTAFSDSELKSFFNSDRCDKFDVKSSVITRHYHFYSVF